MNRRALIFAATIAATLSWDRAFASGKPEEKPAAAGQYVELAPVALPIVAYGEVVNYIFVYVRLELTKKADASKLRAREPYFRDALVRAAHRTPFNSKDDYVSLDAAKLKAVMMREAVTIAGAGVVTDVKVLSQSPKRRTGLPKPKGV